MGLPGCSAQQIDVAELGLLKVKAGVGGAPRPGLYVKHKASARSTCSTLEDERGLHFTRCEVYGIQSVDSVHVAVENFAWLPVHAVIKAHLRSKKEFTDAGGLVMPPSDVSHHLRHDNRQGLQRDVRTYSYQPTLTRMAWRYT